MPSQAGPLCQQQNGSPALGLLWEDREGTGCRRGEVCVRGQNSGWCRASVQSPTNQEHFSKGLWLTVPTVPRCQSQGALGKGAEQRPPPPAPGVMAGGAEGGGSWVKEDWSWGGEQGGAVGVSWWVSLELGLGWSGG